MAEEQKDQPSFRITYYAFQGRAGSLRAAASLGGVSYEDVFTSGEEHKKAKEEGTRRWSGVPELVVFDKDGKELITLGQSNACTRYIGKVTGLYPENAVERALVDEILDSVEDVLNVVSPTFGIKDEEKKKAARAKLCEPDKLPYWIGKFEARLEENEKRGNKNGYFVGDKITIADLKAYYGFQFLTSGNLDYIDGAKLMEPAKRCQAFVAKIKENEGMKKMEEAFAASQKEYKENKVKSFKRPGKFVCGSL
mmetsp:Transcript_38133/g.33682  ORF Transcript_38133/g.33682 Transcript_38133/m.33682 type:complete len:252 (+) Transcript_38133:112-867(+)|eukprot:CAMPEP_0201572394 /NCGR_PEP_ID=MMETSP0190_2-20130828/15620_1 /ASSEMBLY_ACC=CAM_ASM_000263 /TAXON_ID=37353 /ORGANISM="Rosalina sp." /LENGTH=251 /DNA_ID=CAMNT_0047998085 /DNA_START=94 /DNA_END=849 /DNA_ORIENTATION=-